MAFLKDSKFFFTLYHAGKVNIILHVVSFSFLLYGLTVKSVPLVLIGLFIFDEMGHAYNYFFVHNRDPRFGLRMIPYQLLYVLRIFGLPTNERERLFVIHESFLSRPPSHVQ